MRRHASLLCILSIVLTISEGKPASGKNPCSDGSCNYYGLCFWVDKDYVDGPGKLGGNNGWWGNFPHASCKPPHAQSTAIWPFPPAHGHPTWNDCVSSICNCKPGWYAVLYHDVSMKGGNLLLLPGQCYANLGDIGMNDAISSNAFYRPLRSARSTAGNRGAADTGVPADAYEPPGNVQKQFAVLRAAGWVRFRPSPRALPTTRLLVHRRRDALKHPAM